MTEIYFHNFDADGYYTGSALAPVNPVTGKVADINPDVATRDAVPDHDPMTQRVRRVVSVWIVEDIPQPEPEPNPTEPTIEEERDRVRSAMNPLRDLFLNRLAGIAVFTETDSVKVQCSQIRTALLDITKDPVFLSAQTYQEMQSALITRYREIASSASEEIRNVFRELEV